ncbi:hypothetical protein [Tateyamaria sp. Alg231-49]|uniref:hypothetical protein n=1 Tax=Tateyamaria sp. Alg231-49 TaxID=1922219 RepID=UPI000D559751|nr:hypothetical protein [Tateyamaria sp. Alg231-49]
METTRLFLNQSFGHVIGPELIEIAYSCSDGGAITRAKLFENKLEGRASAAQFAGQVNATQGVNVYFAPSLRKMDSPRGKRTKKINVLGFPMVWAYFDDPGAAAAARPIYEAKGAPHSIVVTGKNPAVRAQGFWLLDRIVNDQNELDEMLAGVHVGLEFHVDPKVVNADRVMCLPGCISWPKPGKEGRIAELTEHALPEGAPTALYDRRDQGRISPERTEAS